MIASGDYTDLMNISDYAAGPEAALNEDIIIDLGEYLEDNMPNYSKIIHADQNVYSKVQDADMFLCIFPIKDQNANPGGIGTFVRMDWLEDLGLDVPTTYDELTDVLTAFKNEKGAIEPMSLFNTVSMQNGLLMGGFGSMAELSANAMGTDLPLHSIRRTARLSTVPPRTAPGNISPGSISSMIRASSTLRICRTAMSIPLAI